MSSSFCPRDRIKSILCHTGTPYSPKKNVCPRPLPILLVKYRKNLNNWTVCYVVGLSSPSMVKKFFFFFLSQRGGMGRVFAVFFAPYPEKGIPDYIAHRPIIQVFTVSYKGPTCGHERNAILNCTPSV